MRHNSYSFAWVISWCGRPSPFFLSLCSLLLGGGGGRILEEEGGSFWVVFILEDRRPHDVQGEARNTAEDLEVISLQREGIISNCFPHHASYFFL